MNPVRWWRSLHPQRTAAAKVELLEGSPMSEPKFPQITVALSAMKRAHVDQKDIDAFVKGSDERKTTTTCCRRS